MELFREIYRYVKATNKIPIDDDKNIDYDLQDQIIKTFSRNLLAMIRDIQEHGEKLYEIAYAMGEISRNYLYEYGEIGNGKLPRRARGHGGSTVGFTGEFYISPSTDTGFVRLSNVNAILDYTSEGWLDIGHTTDQIRTNVMRKTGLLPLVDYAVLFPITGSIIVLLLTGEEYWNN